METSGWSPVVDRAVNGLSLGYLLHALSLLEADSSAACAPDSQVMWFNTPVRTNGRLLGSYSAVFLNCTHHNKLSPLSKLSLKPRKPYDESILSMGGILLVDLRRHHLCISFAKYGGQVDVRQMNVDRFGRGSRGRLVRKGDIAQVPYI